MSLNNLLRHNINESRCTQFQCMIFQLDLFFNWKNLFFNWWIYTFHACTTHQRPGCAQPSHTVLWSLLLSPSLIANANFKIYNTQEWYSQKKFGIVLLISYNWLFEIKCATWNNSRYRKIVQINTKYFPSGSYNK